jgi:hypothetical protein
MHLEANSNALQHDSTTTIAIVKRIFVLQGSYSVILGTDCRDVDVMSPPGPSVVRKHERFREPEEFQTGQY